MDAKEKLIIEPTCIEAKDLKKKVPTFSIMKKVD